MRARGSGRIVQIGFEVAHAGLRAGRPPRRLIDDVLSSYVASVPAGRFGTRDDIAHAVSFFASEEAAFVTGQRLILDGGRALS